MSIKVSTLSPHWEADLLDDLAAKIDALVQSHPSYTQALDITKYATDHLRLLAAFNKTLHVGRSDMRDDEFE